MIITCEKSLKDFEFWSGGKDRAVLLTDEEMAIVEQNIEELYPNGIDETALNDLFWFDFEWICELIGTDEETVMARDEA